MSIVPFDLDAELSAKPKEIGVVNWVSRDPLSIESISPYSDDDKLAIVTTKNPHGLTAGDQVYITGFAFMIDGRYEVINHPHKTVNKLKVFAIEQPERLNGEKLTDGFLHRPASFNVYYSEHLPLQGAAEMKKLEVDKLSAYRALTKYQEFSELSTELSVQTNSLAKSAKIKPEDENAFGRRIGELKQVEDVDAEIGAIKKDFGITLKTFDERVKAIAALVKNYEEKAVNLEIDEALLDAITGRIMELQKREIEILCQMPHGLMSALDNLSAIGDVLEKVYSYVISAHNAASEKHKSPVVGNEKAAA